MDERVEWRSEMELIGRVSVSRERRRDCEIETSDAMISSDLRSTKLH